VIKDGEDAWEVWNGPLDTLLQCGPAELRLLVARGERGLIGLWGLLNHLVVEYGVVGVLFQDRLRRLMDAMDTYG
jgi:hypothetical protein